MARYGMDYGRGMGRGFGMRRYGSDYGPGGGGREFGRLNRGFTSGPGYGSAWPGNRFGMRGAYDVGYNPGDERAGRGYNFVERDHMGHTRAGPARMEGRGRTLRRGYDRY